MLTYALFAVAPCLIGVAVVVAVIRANKDDLPAIVRALMRLEARGEERHDDHDDDVKPPALPKP